MRSRLRPVAPGRWRCATTSARCPASWSRSPPITHSSRAVVPSSAVTVNSASAVPSGPAVASSAVSRTWSDTGTGTAAENPAGVPAGKRACAVRGAAPGCVNVTVTTVSTDSLRVAATTYAGAAGRSNRARCSAKSYGATVAFVAPAPGRSSSGRVSAPRWNGVVSRAPIRDAASGGAVVGTAIVGSAVAGRAVVGRALVSGAVMTSPA